MMKRFVTQNVRMLVSDHILQQLWNFVDIAKESELLCEEEIYYLHLLVDHQKENMLHVVFNEGELIFHVSAAAACPAELVVLLMDDEEEYMMLDEEAERLVSQ